jgi:glycosyltransferase involved in cell wall biosynthesis
MKRLFLLFCFFLNALFQLDAYQDHYEIVIKEHLPPRKGPKHIHWCTMCGADNKYAILKETIEIIEPFFDEIHIIDNGSTDETPTLVHLSPKISYKRIENWNGDWTRCYYESIRYVRKGEWFMFHDSDERPSPELLVNLKEITQFAEQRNINSLSVPSCHHSYDDANHVHSNYDKVLVSTNSFTKENFLRRENMVIRAFGSHTGFQLFEKKAMPLRKISPSFFYNHYKSSSDVRISVFTQGFMFPTSFSGLQPYAHEILRLREELGITEITQLFAMLHTKKVPQPMLDFISKWEHVKGEPHEVWELIIRDRCTYQLPTHCDQACCKYPSQRK